MAADGLTLQLPLAEQQPGGVGSIKGRLKRQPGVGLGDLGEKTEVECEQAHGVGV